MPDFHAFYQRLQEHGLGKRADVFKTAINEKWNERQNGVSEFDRVIDSLGAFGTEDVDLRSEVRIGRAEDVSAEQRHEIEQQLRLLMPWRKGPFSVFGIDIDTEWRSDWKWDRVRPHCDDLRGRRVLDVGCGSGYHCCRMLGAGAAWVLGIEPANRYVAQFYALQAMTRSPAAIDLIPLTLEAMPRPLNFFDTCFSMGVLYHRRSPMDHLLELRDCLRPGGQLILETLIIEGSEREVLVPQDRYAMMPNVWFIPSPEALLQWLEKCGFESPHCVDINRTSAQEQHSTPWMESHSLPQFLDPEDPTKTLEGYPAPLRAVFVATRRSSKS